MVGGRHDLLAEWMAYDAIDPMGETRADIRNANLCLVIASVFSKKRNLKLSDFMLDFTPPIESESDLKYVPILKALYGNNS